MGGSFHVKDGDKLICTLGNCESDLCVPISHGNTVGGRPGATIADCESGVNIKPFGQCREMTPSKDCSPVILNQWVMGDRSMKIDGDAALLSSSILCCARGGIIKVIQ